MKGFFIKKAFFDGWDNMIGMVVMNLVFIGLACLGIYGFTLGAITPVLGYAAIIVVWLITCLLLGGTANVAKSYSDYAKDSWLMFKEGFTRNIRHSLVFFLVSTILFSVILVVMPFYFMMDNLFGFIITLVLFWAVLLVSFGLPFYFALMEALPGDRAWKTFKKTFIIVLDNPGFAIFYFFYNIINIAISIFTMGLIPGLVGLQLAAQDAVKLLMFKYDYLEENPEADRKHLNWEDLIFEEREKVGPRSFKGMIFPWKD